LESKIQTLLQSLPAVCPPHISSIHHQNRFSISGNILTDDDFLQKWTAYKEGKKKGNEKKIFNRKEEMEKEECGEVTKKGRGRPRKNKQKSIKIEKKENDGCQITQDANDNFEEFDQYLEEALQEDIIFRSLKDEDEENEANEKDGGDKSDGEEINNCVENSTIKEEYLQAINIYSNFSFDTVAEEKKKRK
jgi:hypothetical protein